MKESIILELAEKHGIRTEGDSPEAIISFANSILEIVDKRSVWVLFYRAGNQETIVKYYHDFPKLDNMLLDKDLGAYSGNQLRELHKNREVKISKGFHGDLLKLVKLKNGSDTIAEEPEKLEEGYQNYSAAKHKLLDIFGEIRLPEIEDSLKHVSFPMSAETMKKAIEYVKNKPTRNL